MSDIGSTLKSLKRPGILVSAARKGLEHYRRDRDLTRILRGERSTRAAAERLLATEARIEETRRAGDGTYSVSAHIAVLTALIAEARLQGVGG